ncbi:8-oxo-dGTP diphosphatase [Ktedonosporobacter rubrisoli]|uniref:8-oxo-dGTP diphosphatase n=1 Tax=Ktedonosporobacter rubrisoli TaxID=2509675 RepID=A0A4P6K4H0_KTERU|nr:8-oxo-dGTP diphosphatase [Ktedonosporobacter rubrisoli]QBD82426.1 8-oxo-dGTP diphosphatase [Ktedonosporobacter rubrisoli]
MFKPILATLGYILSADSRQVLMIHRNKRHDDLHYGKYNGLGGKLEPDEDIITGMRREIYEEAGIMAESMLLRGTISWPGFGKNGADWFGFIFRIESWHGDVRTDNAEGTLEWVPRDSLLSLSLWPGDRLFLPMVFDEDPRPFHGCMPYHKGEIVSWSFQRV